MAPLSPETLIIGIQDLNGIPYGATLRVKQHANTIQHSIYLNVGNPVSWHHQNLAMKVLHGVRIIRPWRNPFAAYHFSNRKANELGSLLQRSHFKRIILTEIWTYRYLPIVLQYRKNAEVVVDLHNVESFLQKQMMKKAPTISKQLFEGLQFIIMRRMEKQFITKSDSVRVCSKDDANLINALYGRNAVVIPNAIDVASMKMQALTTDKSIGYVGCFNYPPNREAAIELITQVLPRILPVEKNLRVKLIGKNPPEDLMMLSRLFNAFINVTGEVSFITQELKDVRTMVMPIRSGSGTRLKVLEAMAHGIPIVATAKAVEGIPIQDGVHYLRAETPDDFAKMILFLWSNRDIEEAMRTNARQFVEAHNSWEAVR